MPCKWGISRRLGWRRIVAISREKLLSKHCFSSRDLRAVNDGKIVQWKTSYTQLVTGEALQKNVGKNRTISVVYRLRFYANHLIQSNLI